MTSSSVIPEQGQLVEVRQHRYMVNDLSKSALPRSALLAGDGGGATPGLPVGEDSGQMRLF